MDRWFFYDPLKHETFVLDNPSAHPGFQRWKVTRKTEDGRVLAKEPLVLLEGVRLQGRKLRATQNENAPCTPGCKKATEPMCVCSCGGKNHGADNMGFAEGADPLDVVWKNRGR